MSDKPLPYVRTDRRRHTSEGEIRPDAEPREPQPVDKPQPIQEVKPEPTPIAVVPPPAEPEAVPDPTSDDLPPAPTAEQMEQSRVAFNATAERLDIAVRAANPAAEHPPALSFESIIQSVYMQAIMQLGGGTPEGQQPQIDILGARQSIDMLGILADKTKNNLSEAESGLLASALFELRIAFLEVTQALARSAQQRASAGPPPPGAPQGGPRIVR
jgi:hypothetical protein